MSLGVAVEGPENDDAINEALGPQDLTELLGEENSEIVNSLIDSMGEEATGDILGQAIADDNTIDVDAIREALGEGATDEAVEDAVNDMADVIEDGLDYLTEQVAAAGMDPDMVAQVIASDPELLAEGKAAFGEFLTDGSMRASDARVEIEAVAHRMAEFDGSETDAKVAALDYVEAKANLDIAERVKTAARDEFNRSYLVLLRAGVPQFEG